MVTVFTPTYNRAHLLDRLYRSLERQTCKDFEWVVVDDGSADGTPEYFSSLTSASFPVVYLRQANGGKHRAINRGVKAAGGDLFFIVDSDDYLTDDAVEKISAWAASLDSSRKWAGVSGAKGYESGKTVGETFKGEREYVDAKNTQRNKYSLNGDKAEAYFTDVLRKYPFPEFEGETFLTEETVWNLIAADGYYLRWFRDIIYVCEYLEGGLTKSGDEKYRRNPQGVLCWVKVQLKAYPKNLRKRMAAVYRYYIAVGGAVPIKKLASDIGISTFMCRLAVMAGNLIKRKEQ